MAQTRLQQFQKKFNLLKFNTKTWLAGTYFTLMKKDRIRMDNVEILVPYEVTDVLLRGQFQINAYERRERRYLKQYLKTDASVLDLGGCLGVVSCVANKLLRYPEQHLVVEANPILIQYIEANRAHNHCRFEIEHCMVSSQPVNTFYVGPTILESSNLRAWNKQVEVPGKTIEQLENQYGFRFDTLIMDIEGGELPLLRENKAWLKQLHTLFMEFHPYENMLSPEEVTECRQIVEDAGLKLRVEDGQIWVFTRSIE
jgi:FkbM family methyltransferase